MSDVVCILTCRGHGDSEGTLQIVESFNGSTPISQVFRRRDEIIRLRIEQPIFGSEDRSQLETDFEVWLKAQWIGRR